MKLFSFYIDVAMALTLHSQSPRPKSTTHRIIWFGFGDNLCIRNCLETRCLPWGLSYERIITILRDREYMEILHAQLKALA